MVTVINQPIHVFMIIYNEIMHVANCTVYNDKKQQYAYSYGGCINYIYDNTDISFDIFKSLYL